MKRFKYKAKDNKGNLITGEVEAVTEEQAAKLVRNQGLIVTSLKVKKEFPIAFVRKFLERITFSDITTFTRQLATMTASGLPIIEALVILRAQARGNMQFIISKILADVEDGQSLSASLSKHPHVFSKTYIALVKSGEAGGVLDNVLTRMADDMEKQQEFRGKVKTALIYPAIIFLGMIAVGFIMMVFVVPRLTLIYKQFNVDLPFMTKVFISISDFMVKFWFAIILAFGIFLFLFNAYRRTETGRKKIDELLFKIPLVGPLQRAILLTDLTRTLSLMLKSGVSIIEALSISSEVVKNQVVAYALIDARKMVEKGFPLAFAFSRHPDAFPVILSQMLAVGEETGKIDEILAKVSHVFEVESDQKLKALTAAIEPIILIILGVGVGLLVISIILPIYNLTTQIK